MILVWDIGNTNIVVGAFKNEELLFEYRIHTNTSRTVDEYIAILDALFTRRFGASYSFSNCIISSVVPPITPDIIHLTKEMFKLEPLVVGPGIKTGLVIKVNEPQAVGTDRIVNAVAAKEILGTPSIVVDFGTATSFDVVSKDGAYQGGIIAPGLRLSVDALSKYTAKLPRIEFSWPISVIGKSTVAAMQAGAVVGYTCLVDGLIDKIWEELGEKTKVLATGGVGELISKHSSRISSYDPHFNLKGLRILAGLNF